MEFEYFCHGTCSRKINFRLDSDNTVHDIRFTGGCDGNLKAIPKILEGWDADEIIKRLLGNQCEWRGTSCADQLAKALIQAKEKAGK